MYVCFKAAQAAFDKEAFDKGGSISIPGFWKEGPNSFSRDCPSRIYPLHYGFVRTNRKRSDHGNVDFVPGREASGDVILASNSASAERPPPPSPPSSPSLSQVGCLAMGL